MKGAVSMYDRKAFKQEAKQLMHASTPHFMLVALVYILLTTGLSYVVTWLTGSGPLAGVLSVFLNILVWLFSIVMAVGFANYALRLARREPTGMGSLFAAFSFSGRALGVQLLTALYIFLWSLLFIVAFGIVTGVLFALEVSIPLTVLIVVILYIALVVLIVVIALRYAMASFALVDAPDDGVMEAIRRSVRMMRGYKGKYFVLELSFIGWELLIALIVSVVMGIGLMVSDTSWIFQAAMNVEYNPWMVYDLIDGIMAQMALWTLLAEVLSLPLALWLAVYRQTAAARFYNYVGGYDYHQYMNAQQPTTPDAPSMPPVRPSQPPAGGYYTPQPPVVEQPAEAPGQEEEAQQPQTPAGQDGFYTSVLPPETSGETPEDAPGQPDEEEEI